MGDSIHYGQPLVDCHICQCWEELAHKVDFAHQRTQVDSFNKSVCVCVHVHVLVWGGCMCVCVHVWGWGGCMCGCVHVCGVCMCGCVHV